MKESQGSLDWEKKLVFIFGLLILLSGLYQTFLGERSIGLLTLLCFIAIIAPGYFTKNYIKKFPIEIEILLFIMVFLQFVVGETRDLYTSIPYYDKIVHYMLPMFLGILGFLIFYTMYITGKLKTSKKVMMFIVIFITIGIGGTWEIIEYTSDLFLVGKVSSIHHAQGNQQQDPLTDTMTDLIFDSLGAIFGSFLGLFVMRKNYGKNGRLTTLIDEVNQVFDKSAKRIEIKNVNQ
jgi:uncharacterized membrane protein YjdF